MELVADRLRPVLVNAKLPKTAHNGKYDLTVLKRHGMEVQGLDFDTMIAAYLLEPSRRGLGLKSLAWAKLGLEMKPITELIGKGRDQITLAQVSISDTAAYAGADADATLRLVGVLEGEGPVSPEVPASILQEHDDCILFLDEPAASRLQR